MATRERRWLWMGLAALSLAFASAEVSHANIVTNGDFETPDAGSSYVMYAAGSAFGGWSVETGSVDLVGTDWQAAAGRQSVDVTGSTGDAGSIYQDLSTIPGQTYMLRFALAGNPVGAPTMKSMEIWWGNSLTDTVLFDTTGRSRRDVGWVYREYSVVATTYLTRLRFRSLTPGFDGPMLDDVSVTPVGAPDELFPQACGQSFRSLEATIHTSIEFTNLTTQVVLIYWIDYQGQPRLYAALQPGNSYVQVTYLTHPWLVIDAAERCLGIYLPTARPGRVVLRS
jgi:choice-of-anchor C domain-containing protein